MFILSTFFPGGTKKDGGLVSHEEDQTRGKVGFAIMLIASIATIIDDFIILKP